MTLSTLRWATALVCASVVTFAASARAATVVVPAGGDLQAAIDAAQAGDVIALAPGATYVGNFTLPNKGALADFITIRSAADDRLLPPAGVRITPAYAVQLPKIKSPNTAPALRTKTAANHWKLLFLEFPGNDRGYNDVIDLGAGDSTQTDLSQVPYALIVDRVYVHGDPVMGQKRGIGLNSSDTQILNSWISECKAIGQDSQAIGGWNGPGNYLIENNYLEGAAENFLLGGSDPPIQNLVTTNVTFRGNYLSKPVSWRDPIIATPANVAAIATAGAGVLAPGTYAYQITARVVSYTGLKASSAASAEVMATVPSGTSGAVTISWTPVVGATDYVVYGRTAGGENMYWATASPYFTDTGAAGTSGKAPSAAKWTIKNVFELKNAQDVLVEGNIIENVWVAGQSGYAVTLTPRNQNGTAPWTVVQRVTLQHNVIRHAAGGVNILGTDNVNPSQMANHILVRDNVLDDISSTWGTGGKVFLVGAGGDSFGFDHNTIVTNDSTIVSLYGGTSTNPTPITNFSYTNSMSEHRTYGFFGSGFSTGLSSINAYVPGSTITNNVLAGGSASKYPSGNFFPSVAAWQASFAAYAAGDYHLLPGTPYKNAATDGTDLGANVDLVNSYAANALTGDARVAAGTRQVQITTTALPDAMLASPYDQTIGCVGGSPACAWQIVASTLPDGIAFNTAGAVVSGTPTTVQTGSITMTAYDPSWPSNSATATFTVTVDPPPLVITIPPAPPGQVGAPYLLNPAVSGALGTATWSLVAGVLPTGITVDAHTGAIAGVPLAWGATTAVLEAADSWSPTRTAVAAVTISIAPAPITVTTTVLAPAAFDQPYASTLTASGGTGVASWTLVAGALPAGLSLSSAGVISGTPTAVGVSTFTVRATDGGWSGDVASQSLTIAVHAREIILRASDVAQLAGTWALVADATAAGGVRIWNPDLGAPKLSAPLASPANYFEIAFEAEAGVPYHFWLRGKADKNSWANDSVYIQFDQSVTAAGAPVYRIGTTTGDPAVNLEDCAGCGLSGWGWQDNGYGVNVLGPDIYFAQSGIQRLRVQVREDGFSIDQIVLSADRYHTASPGALKADTTILVR